MLAFSLCILAIFSAHLIAAEDNCKVTREDCIVCARHYCDINRDGGIDVEEIRAIKNKYLTFWERFFAWALNQSPERMMELCDADNNGLITEIDFKNSSETCLAECMKRELFWNKICMPAAEEEHERIERERQEKFKKLQNEVSALEDKIEAQDQE